MRQIGFLIACGVVVLVMTAPTFADWYPGDGHKMHFPQLPDPNGWDVELFRHNLADDWECSMSGPVTDIHFWLSWYEDDVGILEIVDVWICADNGGEPGEILWQRIFNNVPQVDPYGTGLQGFFVPELPDYPEPDNHFTYQQANLVNIEDPFIQTLGERYWLVLYVDWAAGVQSPPGWKTSQDHFGAVPVWWDYYDYVWAPLYDPLNQQPLSFSFVITGGDEPTSTGGTTWGQIKKMYR